VLVVDDDPDMLALLQTALLTEGYHVLVAGDGAQALEHLRREKIGLILSDVMMPSMNGYELVSVVKENAPSDEIPFLFFSAQSDVDDRLKGLELGAVDYISKPVNAREVCLRVRNILAQQSKREARRASLVMGALNLIQLGIIILDEYGNVQMMNRTASTILAENDGLHLRRNRLCGRTPADTRLIEELLGEALKLAHDFDLSQVNPLRLARPSHKRDYALVTIPLDLDPDPSAADRTVTVVVHDPETTLVPPIELLMNTYHFTQAEARVAGLLIQGRSIPEICEELGVSRNTVATHLKKLYLKTDTQRQSDFTRFLLSGLSQLKLD